MTVPELVIRLALKGLVIGKARAKIKRVKSH